ncbi:MAG TPA: pyruvate ferredoxin oxidoreductase [Thermoprotei archaeon]|nr:pyruvate ferredoxin oxidoreductase [Euryarchaeota archaeon]MCD6158619.1 pyruvate ferredoxin oxidoreductase [Euryarchaeota archaeon]HDJ51166.1 pyruvate ferredoxin oxidoreductase [Thermoprotei archaeon]
MVKPVNLKQISAQKELLSPGHRMCAGCVAAIIARQVLHAAQLTGYDFVVINATGCLEVATTIYPYTAWRVPWLHNAFENAASTGSGVEAAIRALKRKGILKKDIKVIIFGGDGGTYDIGLQALSGAIERGHDFLYICYNNEAYMNTGIQRSGATPLGAWTTTSPVGRAKPGKTEHRKDLPLIIAAHGAAYTATANPAFFMDLMTKVQKGIEIEGPAYIEMYSDCNRGWRHDTGVGIKVAKMATETRIWPLYEVEGKFRNFKINYKPSKKVPVEEWIKLQGRFRHLLKEENRWIIEEIQRAVDENWERLLKLEETFGKK